MTASIESTRDWIEALDGLLAASKSPETRLKDIELWRTHLADRLDEVVSCKVLADVIARTNLPGETRLTVGSAKSVVEPVYETARRLLILQILKVVFEPWFVMGFVNGSLAYAPFLNVHRLSDIDLTVIYDIAANAFAACAPFDNAEEFKIASHWMKELDTPEIAVRSTFCGCEVTIHFTSQRWFEAICNVDLFSCPTSFTKYRTSQRVGGGRFDGRYAFDRSSNVWNNQTGSENGLVYIKQPIFAVDDDGRFVNGVLTDKFVVSRFLFGDKPAFEKNRSRLLRKMAARLAFEKQQGLVADTRGRLANAFNRMDSFAPRFLKEIESYEIIKT
ncbi:hypothetical protein [Bradyrhizobium sp.]